jgi:hypothetical protein
MATDWYYQKSGAPGQSTGPLTWEQLYAARASGALQIGDLVWHASLPQWTPAGQIPNLFPATAQPAALQQAPHQQAPYQQTPYQQAPYQAAPYQQAPHQSMPYQQAGAPAWAGPPAYQPAYRKKTSVAAWLIPLIVLILVGGGLGAYFGFFYNKGEAVAATDLEGLWEGTLRYTSIELDDPTEEDLAIREATLNTEIPATLELTLDDGVSSTALPVRAATRAAGDDDKAVTGTAVFTMDLSDIVEEAGVVTEEMTFAYADGKLILESTDPSEGEESVTAEVTRKGDKLVMEGKMTFEDDTSSAKGEWNMTKEAPADDGGSDGGDDDGGDSGSGDKTGSTEDDGPAVTEGGGDEGGADSAFVPADLNGRWEGSLTVTSYSGEPWEQRGLTSALLDRIQGIPIPATMEMKVDDSGVGTGQMIVSATSLGAEFDIGTSNMAVTISGTTVVFQPDSWPWGVPTMTGEVSGDTGGLTIEGTFVYESASATFEAAFSVTK